MSDILELVVKSEKNLFVGLAGPGTGKSFTFETIVKSEQFQGKRILILSFINKLVDDLKVVFASYGNVEVSTLHSFAMQAYRSQVKRAVELDEVFDDIVTQDCYHLVGKSINYREKFYDVSLEDDDVDFYRERSAFYSNGDILHSFSSVIFAVNRLFAADSKRIPEYDLILVDEFQDFNELEWTFISLLNSRNKVVIVGDDDQSLYDWKSAKPQLIRDLYTDSLTEGFSLDYCYRCTEVIVNAVNSLVSRAKGEGLLGGRVDDKKYIYPTDRKDNKNEISAKYNRIDFLPRVSGHQLFYQLAARIKKDTENERSKRVLVLVPSYFKQSMYEGLVKEGLNVVEFELFGDEKHKTIKHRHIIDSFKTLQLRKTDNLAIRKILHLYADEQAQKDLLTASAASAKKLWNCMDADMKAAVEADIALFKKVRQGRDPLTQQELIRLNDVFNLKNLLSKMINGFNAHTKNGIEVELTTVMSSKGLSADFVYYVGVDDYLCFDQETNALTDSSVCEFLVGITRAKEKLTLTSFKEVNPKLVTFIGEHINRVKLRAS